MTPDFDMKKVTTPLLLHMLGKEMAFPAMFLLRCKLTLKALGDRPLFVANLRAIAGDLVVCPQNSKLISDRQ